MSHFVNQFIFLKLQLELREIILCRQSHPYTGIGENNRLLVIAVTSWNLEGQTLSRPERIGRINVRYVTEVAVTWTLRF